MHIFSSYYACLLNYSLALVFFFAQIRQVHLLYRRPRRIDHEKLRYTSSIVYIFYYNLYSETMETTLPRFLFARAGKLYIWANWKRGYCKFLKISRRQSQGDQYCYYRRQRQLISRDHSNCAKLRNWSRGHGRTNFLSWFANL